ncbi:MAG: N-acetyl-alpha-D-glucosaminyl L-malate synthase BshA [Bacillaceae bacterium]|nr:N-acetyl-alpha-D-glucosaminyl L-malate synthase BshA [Bacillaceae bacterium]
MGIKIGIACYASVGGSGVIATELGKMLAEKGYEVHFISSDMPFRLNRIYSNIYFHEVNVSNYPVFQYPPYDLALANKMADVINREKLDILHAHYAMPHAICAILARQMVKKDVKIVTTLHGTDITVLGIDASFKNMIRFGIEQSDRVTAVSRSLKKQTEQMLDIRKPIDVVYNFVNEQDYYKHRNEELKSHYGIRENEKVIIHISNFRKVKRAQDVIHVFHKVADQIPAKLLLVGDGPEYCQINQLAKDLNLEDQVLFLGKQENVFELLSIADLKLLVSEKESFGLVLLEAMACGVPCIGTEVGGIPEVILDGETGYLCQVRDIDGMAEKALSLLTDDEKWKQFSQASIQRVEKYFHSNTIINQYETIYQELLKDDA